MENHKVKTASINDFREWSEKKELILAPAFQRRKVWLQKAKSYLLDTIIKGFPIPAIYIRQKIDLKKGKTIREVVDGQQRISTILDYVNDEIKILKIHNEKFANLKFSELPNEVKQNFLEYELPVVFLVGAGDRDVLEVFDRINSYTVTLNQQEKLNADFSGKFKQAVFKTGRDHLNFWKNFKILSNYNLMRMKEVELCSDLIIAMIDGIQDRKNIRHYYEIYDNDFPQEKEVISRFKNCIDKIVEIYGDSLTKSAFKKRTLFYSLFCAIYDIVYGLPKTKTKIQRIQQEKRHLIREALDNLNKELQKPSFKYVGFKDAATRHTTDLSNRLIRHRIIVKEILGKLAK